jgi:Tfp pilus assembly protein FimT
MKLPQTIPAARRQTGIMLMQCLVYMSVFAILLGIGTAAFYFCWDHTRAVISATDDIASALHAGERWRADVRSATGTISVEAMAAGETVRIPKANGGEIRYRFENGELRREMSDGQVSWRLLSKVKASEMKTELRSGVTAWRWELELTPRRKEGALPLRFTFEAAQTKP